MIMKVVQNPLINLLTKNNNNNNISNLIFTGNYLSIDEKISTKSTNFSIGDLLFSIMKFEIRIRNLKMSPHSADYN